MSLRLWLPFNGNLKNQGISYTSCNPSSSSYSFSDNGKLGTCLKTTTSSEINTGLTSDLWDYGNNSVSFCGWFKFPSNDISTYITSLVSSATSTNTTVQGALLGKNSYGGCDIHWKTNNLYSDTKFSTISVYGSMRTNDSQSYQTNAYTITLDAWTHILFTYNKSSKTISLYINGELFNSTSVTDFTSSNTQYYNFFINSACCNGGNAISKNIPFYVNDVRVYDHCLSKREIKEISKCLFAHYKLDNYGFGNSNLIPNSKWFDTNTASGVFNGNVLTLTHSSEWDGVRPTSMTGYLEDSVQYTLSYKMQKTSGELTKIGGHTAGLTCDSFYLDNVDTGTTYSTGITCTDSTDIHTIKVVFTTTDVSTLSIAIQPNRSVATTVTCNVWDIKIEKGNTVTPWCPNINDISIDSSIEKDISGYGNDMNRVGTLTSNLTSPKQLSSTCTSSSAYISTSKAHNIAKMLNQCCFTVSGWINASDVSSTVIMYSCGSSNAANKNYHAKVTSTSAGCCFYSNDLNGTTTINVNTWYHIANVVSNGTRYVYVNGTLITSSSYTDSLSIDTTGTNVYACIGCNSVGNTSNLNGYVSDLRIYSTALSADEIKKLYNNPISFDKTGKIFCNNIVEN